MNRFVKQTLLNDHFILVVILINSIGIFMMESGFDYPVLLWLDIACTIVFVMEMIAKHIRYGAKGYWRSGWNRMDGILVILSLPSLVLPFLDVSVFNFSVVLTLRLMRVIRFFRLFHFFPNIVQIGQGLKRALRDSGIVIIGFAIMIFLFGLINCSLYRETVPEYFGTPLLAVYSVFRVFTVEGWYEIPEAIAQATAPWVGSLSRFYFSLLLAAFGILGLSFINSVFVDAMVEDNNDDVKAQLRRMEQQLTRTEQQLQELKKLLNPSHS